MDFNSKLLLLFFANALLIIQVKTQTDAATYHLNQASLNLFQVAQRLNIHDANMVVSPVGMLTLVALYASGTSGALQQDIVRALGAGDINELTNNYSKLGQGLANSNLDALAMVSKIFVAPGFTFTQTFLNAVYKYVSEVATIDFSNPNDAASIINNWASQKTKGLISNPVQPLEFSPTTVLALFNAIYFRGSWKTPFDLRNTKYQSFTTSRGDVVPKPMMNIEQYLDYSNIPGVGEFVKIPYQEPGFSMVVGLPDKSTGGLREMLSKLAANPHHLILENSPGYQPQSISLTLPKFDIKTKMDMKNVLQGMGLHRMFTEPAQNLVQNGHLAVNSALQEAVINVDELGTVAAAISSIGIAGASPYGPKEFNVNRPFMFAVLQGQNVLFLGTVSN